MDSELDIAGDWEEMVTIIYVWLGGEWWNRERKALFEKGVSRGQVHRSDIGGSGQRFGMGSCDMIGWVRSGLQFRKNHDKITTKLSVTRVWFQGQFPWRIRWAGVKGEDVERPVQKSYYDWRDHRLNVENFQLVEVF